MPSPAAFPTDLGTAASTSRWHELAQRVLEGHQPTRAEALAVLQSPDVELLDLVAACYRIRHRHWGNTVQLYFLMNAKSGLCPEDCGYCSQSKISKAEIPVYNLLSETKLLDAARVCAERGASTYCLVISARGPTEREIQAVEHIVPKIKQQYKLNVCACLGLLTPEQAQRLKACGVDKVNHNLNTSERFYAEICTTHTWKDRLDTLKAVRSAGLELCSGGIIGMGERDDDVVDMAYSLREMQVESIPLNFLNPIDGTPLGGKQQLRAGFKTASAKGAVPFCSADSAKSGQSPTVLKPALNPRYCLKALCLLRLVNPASEIRIAGGREMHLGSMQALGLYVANSVFVGDYLTTKGQTPDADYKMIEEMGFTITGDPTSSGAASCSTNGAC
jgi:biotin synthase